ncbi:MAG: hypothetical protein KDD62_16065, partial [Bdellovibrionales bacterium]|nr:hypothetical protein [Bdellovibrionales bacterium]
MDSESTIKDKKSNNSSCLRFASAIESAAQCQSCPLGKTFLERLGSFVEQTENAVSSDSVTCAFQELVEGLIQFLPSPDTDKILEQLDAIEVSQHMHTLVGRAEFLLEE